MVTTARSAGEYVGSLREILHAFKYRQHRSLAVPLGRLIGTVGAEILAGADCVVPVPLYPLRRMRRGFNQANDLAAALDRPVVHALWRVRATASQTGLHARARRLNVRDAFVASPLLTPRTRESMLAGRIVVLIDDVRTTGATLDACAVALTGTGVREVRALTVAQATLVQHAAADGLRAP
jgi:ComF family protein